MDGFTAYVAERDGDEIRRELRSLGDEDLPPGDVTIAVEWSSVNYKDALAVSPTGKVARISPLVPGVDLAGRVVASDAGDVAVGDAVLAHGHALGVSHHGGFAERARVPAEWVVPLPDGMGARDAMAIGTAGFTAALSVDALERAGLEPGAGPVLVLGASGGVGSVAVAILAARGHEVHASTGKADAAGLLRELGAAEVLDRAQTAGESRRPLESEFWAGCVDPVGGAALAHTLRTLRYGGAVASSGLTGGAELATTVLPFILRGVSLLGIDSVGTATATRRAIWERLAGDLRPAGLERLTAEVALDELDGVLDRVLAGGGRGRTVVRVG
jgi:putative YhdH/YhfP family quinone oxidoreductase